MSNTGFVEAYVSATGEKIRVPEHWIDHPVLWQGLRKTPRTAAAKRQEPTTDAAQPADDERK